MKRGQLKRSDKPMKRSQIKPMSSRRHAENRERRRVMADVFGPRETWACSVAGTMLAAGLMGPCYGPINGHEILTRGRGGSITDPSNILLLCDRHNEWCSSHSDDAHRLGLLKHNWEGE